MDDAIYECIRWQCFEQPRQLPEDIGAIRAPQGNNNNSMVSCIFPGHGVVKIPVRRQKDGRLLLRNFKHLLISKAPAAPAGDACCLVPVRLKKGDCDLREILVEQEPYATAS